MAIKVWKASINSSAKMTVTDDSAYVIGSENRFIKVNANGTTVYGPMSIIAGTESIKTGGMFTQLSNMAKMIPSTMVTPIPDQIPSPPLNIMFDLAGDVAFFASLLSPGVNSDG